MLPIKAKYALRTLMVLASTDEPMLSCRALAKEANVPQKFLDTILQELRVAGYVEAKRGIFGGYFLAKSASEIVLGDVIRLIDGPLAPLRCASQTAYQKCDDCLDVKACRIRHLMLEVRNAISSILDHRTLNDLQETQMGQYVA